VELDREEGETVSSHPDTLVGSVVGVLEELGPSRRESRDVDLVSVVLGGDVASTGRRIRARDVHSSVSVLHLGGGSSRGESEELVTEADSEDGELGDLDGLLDVVDGGLDDGGISGTVGKEETIEGLGLGHEVVVLERETNEERRGRSEVSEEFLFSILFVA